MFESSSWKIFILLPTLLLAAANFDFRVHFCRFKCGDPCATDDENIRDPNGDAPKPGAYYWRDFYGVIPIDAYPLGTDNQNPQTYIGIVYDPSNNGTYPTTIFDGLDYVHSVFNGSVTKRTSPIQILCTQAPERLIWVKLTEKNYETLEDNDKLVIGGISRADGYNYNYVVKASKCIVTYAGTVTSFNTPLEYALLDGTLETTDSFLWLIYRPNSTEKTNEKVGKSIGRPFFSHHYEYTIQPNSIIPKFFKQINIGPCSVTCTNEKFDKGRKLKGNNTLLAAMAYYWKPNEELDLKDVIPGGNDGSGEPLYVGQSYSAGNTYDVGESGGSLAYAHEYEDTNYVESAYFHLLSSNHQDKFEWVNTSSDAFSTLDKSRMIPGGELANGNRVYVGRTTGYNTNLRPGSVRPFENGTYHINGLLGTKNYFQVLMFKNSKEKS